MKRLQKIELVKPEKLKDAAERYTKVFPEKPVAYYFLAKIELDKFLKEENEKTKLKALNLCLKQSTKAQKHDEDEELLNINGWHELISKIRYEAYFYFQESTFSEKATAVKRKYYLFLSKGEREYLMDSELDLKVPEEQQIDSLFYGLPIGTENVKREFPDDELKVLELINTEREKQNLSIIDIDSSMSAACRYHAYDMATQNYFNHFGYDLGSDGRVYFANSTFNRIRQFYNETRVLGENISSGRASAFHTYKGWFNSPGHYNIMFNPLNGRMGIAKVYVPNSVYGYYWVMCTAE